MNCTGGWRHWYSVPREVGLRSPVCVRCGHPNPRPLTDGEWAELEAWARHFTAIRGYPPRGHAGAALRAREETRDGRA